MRSPGMTLIFNGGDLMHILPGVDASSVLERVSDHFKIKNSTFKNISRIQVETLCERYYNHILPERVKNGY